MINTLITPIKSLLTEMAQTIERLILIPYVTMEKISELLVLFSLSLGRLYCRSILLILYLSLGRG